MRDQLSLQDQLRAHLRRLRIDPHELDIETSHLNIVHTNPDDDAHLFFEGKHYFIRILILEQALSEALTKDDAFRVIVPQWREVPDRYTKSKDC